MFVTFETGDLDETIYQDVYMGQGQMLIELTHNYSEPGNYMINISVSNLVR